MSYAEVAWESLRKTRKPHSCFGCLETYPAGSHLIYNTTVADGDVWHGYFCRPCWQLACYHGWGYDGEGFDDGMIKEMYSEEYDFLRKANESEIEKSRARLGLIKFDPSFLNQIWINPHNVAGLAKLIPPSY